MNILILGGDGFIGSKLREYHIKNNDTVTIIDKAILRSNLYDKTYDFILHEFNKNNVDIAFSKIKHNVDFVYNCVAVATPSYYVYNPLDTFNIDFEINKAIIDYLIQCKYKFMHFSTSEVYGKTWNSPYTETSDCVFGEAKKHRWIYATSKLLLDQYILASKCNCCIIRPFNFISHDLDWLPDLKNGRSIDKYWIPRVPSCFLNSLLFNKTLKVVNPGTQKRCYTYIDDAIEGIISILNNWDNCIGEILNIGNPYNEITINDLAKLMIKNWESITNTKSKGIDYIDGEILYGIGYEDSERRLFSNKKMLNLTGWNAKISLSDTIKYTVRNCINQYWSKL